MIRPRAATLLVLALLLTPAFALALGPPDGARADPEGWDFSWRFHDAGPGRYINDLDPVSADVAWLTSVAEPREVLVTIDGGMTFTDVAPSDHPGLRFWDVEALSATRALVMASGFGDSNRVFLTTDGGKAWTETLQPSTSTFFNCMVMSDPRHGFVVGDPLEDDKFQIFVTSDGGKSWARSPDEGMPDALDGESSVRIPSCAAATGRSFFFSTTRNRFFRSDDDGATWRTSEMPRDTDIYWLGFRTNRVGLALGTNSVRTTDGGVTWTLIDAGPTGYSPAWWSDRRGDERSDISEAQRIAFAVGDGSWVSRDRGRTWALFDDDFVTVIDCVEASGVCWAASGSLVGTLVAEETATR